MTDIVSLFYVCLTALEIIPKAIVHNFIDNVKMGQRVLHCMMNFVRNYVY